MANPFWVNEAQLLLKLLLPTIRDMAEDASLSALEMLGADVGVDFALVNEAALALAQTFAYDLVNGLTATSMNLTQDAIAGWITSGEPLEALIESLVPVFGEARAANIGITEVTRLFANANMEAWKASGVVKAIDWMTAEDEHVCAICEPLGDMESQPIETANFAGFGVPPAHPRCRCWLRPVVSAKRMAVALDHKFRAWRLSKHKYIRVAA
jgi:hypothetical protein